MLIFVRNLAARAITIATGFAAAGNAHGREIYVVRAFTQGGLIEAPCTYLYWQDDLRFFNTTSQDLQIRLLGVSNGGPRSNARELVVPASRSRSPREAGLDWTPARTVDIPFWVNRLDLPDGILVSSRAEPTAGVGFPCFPGVDDRRFGSIALPVFSSLSEIGRPQMHLRTDLGKSESGLTAPSRVNVGIYNGGAAEATAVLELRRDCDGRLIAQRTVAVPADTLFQFSAFENDTSPYDPNCPGSSYATYVVVTVDQPSFSYTATMSSERPPKIPVSVSSPN